jgi:hypothetical protein
MRVLPGFGRLRATFTDLDTIQPNQTLISGRFSDLF